MDRAKRERGTKGRQQNARRPRGRIIKGGRERAASRASTTPSATALPLHHGLERSIARRLTEERWRRVKNGRQKVKAMDGGSNRARGHCVRATERWRRDACERQKVGEIERDEGTKEESRDECRCQKTKEMEGRNGTADEFASYVTRCIYK